MLVEIHETVKRANALFFIDKNSKNREFVLDNSPIIVYNEDAPEGWQDREECGR